MQPQLGIGPHSPVHEIVRCRCRGVPRALQALRGVPQEPRGLRPQLLARRATKSESASDRSGRR